jgi:putative flavoprotein involved in K+ transport
MILMTKSLLRYATEFSLPVQLSVKVNHLYPVNNHYKIHTSDQKLIADNVVIATGTNPFPYIPAISSELNPEIFQIHSSGYTNPEALPAGDVLVVGAATSGIEIALEVSKTHKTYISGKPTFHIPDKAIKYGGGNCTGCLSAIFSQSGHQSGRKPKRVLSMADHH